MQILCEKYGGKSLYIPTLKIFESKSYRTSLLEGRASGHMIVFMEILGMSIMDRLCGILGGSRIHVPGLRVLERFVRNEQMVKDFNGRNFEEVARKHGLSTNQTFKILNGDRRGRRKITTRRRRDLKKAAKRR